MGSDGDAISPPWWDEACAQLAARDAVLRGLIECYSGERLQSRGAPFTTLARSVIGQQISVKAAASVWERFALLFPAGSDPTPAAVLALDGAELRGAGLSARKVEYLRSLAQHFSDGRVHIAEWPHMSDAAIAAELTAIRGIGQWTADTRRSSAPRGPSHGAPGQPDPMRTSIDIMSGGGHKRGGRRR